MSAAGWSRLWSIVAFTSSNLLVHACRHRGAGRGTVSRRWRPAANLDFGLRRNDELRTWRKSLASPAPREPAAEIDGDAVHREQENQKDDDRGGGLLDEAAADLVGPEEELHG